MLAAGYQDGSHATRMTVILLRHARSTSNTRGRAGRSGVDLDEGREQATGLIDRVVTADPGGRCLQCCGVSAPSNRWPRRCAGAAHR